MWKSALLASALLAHSPDAAAQAMGDAGTPECSASFICGIQNPEDLVALPGGEWVLISSYGRGGGLFVVERTSRKARPLASNPASRDANHADCAAPPIDFRPHGVDVVAEDRTSARLYVVNHGERESIEIYRLDMTGDAPAASWLGCVLAPANAKLNSVSALPDGSLVATTLAFSDEADIPARLKAGQPSGGIVIWNRESGWRVLERGKVGGPNGVATSRDGKWIYVAGWSDRSVSRRRADGRGFTRLQVAFLADNLRWGEDGLLYATGQIGRAEDVKTCQATPICAWPGGIIAIDPQRFSVRASTLVEGLTGIYGAPTTALLLDGMFWTGTFHGNRIALIRGH